MERNDAQKDPHHLYDLIVIGGGITGAGIARDAALRGLSCLLLEKGDFASGTTSKTTRLIHGGLRYLANLELGLVAESLRERAILRKQVPYLVRPLPILVPIYQDGPHGRAATAVGIHLYDVLSREKDVPHYSTSNRKRTLAFEPRLNPAGLTGSALIYDHQIVMPERLVIENVIGAREAGAALLNYVGAERIEETRDSIIVTARDSLRGTDYSFRSKMLIIAAGPWADQVRQAGNIDLRKIVSPTKGVHLVLPKLTEQALFASSREGRMFFIVPFGDCSLIGTTDTKYFGDLDEVHADRGDVDYLLAESRRILPGLNISREAIHYTYAGVRPLAFSGGSESAISRRHRIVREGWTGRVITIAGGKLTTYRNMAKDAVDEACRIIGSRNACVTDKKPLPGGLPQPYEGYLRDAVPELSSRYGISPETVRHLIGLYGSRAADILKLAGDDPGLEMPLSPDSRDIGAQVLYSIREEGARTLADVILRRMHLGTTRSRGLDCAEAVAELAGRELFWSDDEKRHRLDEFRRTLNKETECLKEPAVAFDRR